MPEPEPTRPTVSVQTTGTKMATAFRAWLIVTVQVAVPNTAQSPVQPANSLPGSAVAVSVTVLRNEKTATQELPQEMPAGVLATLPAPAPIRATESG